MKVSDWRDEFEDETLDEIQEDNEKTLERLRKAPLVSLNYLRELKKEMGWKPLSLEDYTFQIRATQRQIVIRELEKARKITNERVKRMNRLTDKKKD